jgi:type I restriction enzyme S subunit
MEVREIPFAHLLEKIVDNRGKTCPTAEHGIPLIATNCIRNTSLYPSYDKIRYVSKETYETWFRGHPEPGDLIFVTNGTPGRVCMAPDPIDFCIAQDMVAIRADKEKIDPKYLFAVLRSQEIQRRIENMHVGTLIPHFKKGDFDKLFLPIPERRIQEFIGEIYFNFSCKIELNQQMNRTLEGIARALFKSWFIDFDPVRAKLDGRQPSGMDAETAALFPDAFEDGGAIGPIPKGWRVGTLRDCCQRVENGGTPKRTEPTYWEPGTIPWLTSGEVRQDIVTETENFISEDGLAKSSAKLWPPNTTVVAMYGATAGQVCLLAKEICTNQACCGLIPRDDMSYFLYIQASLSVDLLAQQARGSAQQNLSQKLVADFPTIVPEISVLKAFDKQAKFLFEKWITSIEESRILAATRDALLPKLLSGEIRVKEAEQAEEAMA